MFKMRVLPETIAKMEFDTEVIKIQPTIIDKTITENGTYRATDDNADGYSEVSVDVPQGIFPTGTIDINANGMYDVTECANANVNVSLDLPTEMFVFTGNCNRRFYGNGWNWYIYAFGDRVTVQNITGAELMFADSTELEYIPFAIHFAEGGGSSYQIFKGCTKLRESPPVDFNTIDEYKYSGNLFHSCNNIEKFGKLSNYFPSSLSQTFYECRKMKDIPEFENLNLSRIQTYASANAGQLFAGCYSLRRVPEEFLKQLYGIWTSPSNSSIYNLFRNCYALDEVKGLRGSDGIMTSNAFGYTFASCTRLKNIMFDLQENGSPRVVSWKAQTIDLMSYVGYAGNVPNWVDDTLTSATQITDDATYQALKDNPNSWTLKVEYSRYNRISAVNTINTLPDTSQYLSTAGGTNAIKFRGASGSLTDGGAINTMTTEEIAVATAKGWTVSFT